MAAGETGSWKKLKEKIPAVLCDLQKIFLTAHIHSLAKSSLQYSSGY
jgi:hypothetical protein